MVLPQRIPWFAADLYEEIARGSTGGFYQEAARRVLSRLEAENVPGPWPVLDVGAGPGFLPIELARLHPEVMVTGIDLSRVMVDKARANAGAAGLSDRLHFEVGDAARLKFEDRSFRAVVSTGSFHAWKRPITVLNEFQRVLADGGFAWICDPARLTPGRGLRKPKGLRRAAWYWGAVTGRIQQPSPKIVDLAVARSRFEKTSVTWEKKSVVIVLYK